MGNNRYQSLLTGSVELCTCRNFRCAGFGSRAAVDTPELQDVPLERLRPRRSRIHALQWAACFPFSTLGGTDQQLGPSQPTLNPDGLLRKLQSAIPWTTACQRPVGNFQWQHTAPWIGESNNRPSLKDCCRIGTSSEKGLSSGRTTMAANTPGDLVGRSPWASTSCLAVSKFLLPWSMPSASGINPLAVTTPDTGRLRPHGIFGRRGGKVGHPNPVPPSGVRNHRMKP